MEKIAELDNKRKKIEEEKEKFLQNVKRMEAIEAKLKEEKLNEKENNESEQDLLEEEEEEEEEDNIRQELDENKPQSVETQKPEEKTSPVPLPELAKPASAKVTKTPLTTTQGYFRGYLSRKSLDKRTLAAITIQKHIRRYQCRSIYLDIKQAIIMIQRSYRFYRSHKGHPSV
jgi:hypothetical protein